VMSPCYGGCHILASSRMQPLMAAKLILASSNLQSASWLVTVGVAYVSIMGVN
jgi:hypothetical protein